MIRAIVVISILVAAGRFAVFFIPPIWVNIYKALAHEWSGMLAGGLIIAYVFPVLPSGTHVWPRVDPAADFRMAAGSSLAVLLPLELVMGGLTLLHKVL